MVNLKSVKYRNFMAVGSTDIKVDLNSHCTTAIFGKNGVGKTSFVDAITFCLFGKPFRKINKPGLINSINQKDCYCELEFSIGKKNYLVKRGIKPNIFEIHENGRLIDQESKSKDYQSYLEDNILKLNYKSFCQIIVLGTANFVPFMQLSAADRRYIIEDLLDIKVFSDMNVILKEKISTLKDSLNNIENQIEIDSEKLRLHRKYISESKTTKNNKIKENKKLISEAQKKNREVQKEIKILEKSIKKLLQETKDYDIMNIKLTEYNGKYSQAKTIIEQLKNEIQYYTNTLNCGECKQSIPEDFRKDTIKEKKKKIEMLKEKIPILKTKIDGLVSDLKGMFKKIQEKQKLDNKVTELNNLIYLESKLIERIQKENQDLEEFKENTSKIKQKELEELENNRRELENTKSDLIDKRYVYEIITAMLKDSGIKTRIIKQYLPIMNKLINKYLTQMNLFINFTLDESFKEVIKTRNKEDYSYESFSGGERTKINLAILFAWREIAKMKNAANTNLLIFDEIMDSSLDNEGLDDFVKLIQTVAKGTNVFVISHRNGEGLSEKFDSIIRFEKIKGFTVRENVV